MTTLRRAFLVDADLIDPDVARSIEVLVFYKPRQERRQIYPDRNPFHLWIDEYWLFIALVAPFVRESYVVWTIIEIKRLQRAL